MKITLKKATYHAYSDEYRDVYITLYQDADMIRAEAHFCDKLIYSRSEKKEVFSMYTDKEVIGAMIEGVAHDNSGWVDATKCRILSENVHKFRILSKKSEYTIDKDGLIFEMEAILDAETLHMDLSLKNKYNNDVLTLHSSATSELEATDNALVYAEIMTSIALAFKKGQSVLMRSNNTADQHMLETYI